MVRLNMTLTPDATKAITDRITAKSRSMALARMRDLQVEGAALRAEAADLKARLALYCGKVSSAILELRQGDETTAAYQLLKSDQKPS